MRRPDPNLPHLLAIAQALGDLREQVVFIGGSTAGLLLTDPLAEGVRPTLDVDAVVEAHDLIHFYRIEAQLEQRGFMRDADSGVICRWKHKPSGVVFDLMPVDAAVLGFSNRWYGEAVATAQPLQLADGVVIRIVAAPAFVATKLEAFLSRGKGDFLVSHDLEDVLNIVDGRDELMDELQAASMQLQGFVAETFAGLLVKSDFINSLPGLVADADRAGVVRERLEQMAKLRTPEQRN
ncbi:hypothetical protein E2F46_05200 [Luteimonas aestuarii]|uniref:Nucleotidyl transferase AbiEii/AbiGii toxin family protein n=1 Tax=Luteimonas aestuarii TaxID=453837 RepID=A0A4R5TYP9_9GAMM|nr:hypothetical protein [Luteimonas aestuarii]TDK26343.1 hypothetical protein E2F46_05200 [Luteimonas aestuarii]